MTVETFGAELSCSWAVKKWWRLTPGFTWFEFNLLDENGTIEPRYECHDGSMSKYQASLISFLYGSAL